MEVHAMSYRLRIPGQNKAISFIKEDILLVSNSRDHLTQIQSKLNLLHKQFILATNAITSNYEDACSAVLKSAAI